MNEKATSLDGETQAGKPELQLGPAGSCAPLPVATLLSALKPKASRHEERDCRHPLGVYNLSVHRICSKVAKCADRLNIYWTASKREDGLREEIIDYLELALYAAAEHVDDIERIAATFFRTDHDASKSPDVRHLKRAVKPLRDEIASFTNTIKHAYGRIRLFEIDFVHGDMRIPLLGFFVEGFKDGGASPNPILHGGGKAIISVTSYLWNILTFLAQVSAELCGFLQRLDVAEAGSPVPVDAPEFREAALKLTRLPAYSFDDQHPFERVRWVMAMDDAMLEKAASSIYGSLRRPWSKDDAGGFGNSQLFYAGDGVTRSFHLVQPKALRLQHWD